MGIGIGDVIKHITRPAVEAIDDVRKVVTTALERNSYMLIVQNKTRNTLRRVESHNSSDNWPFGDIAPETTEAVVLRRKTFSFAAKYEVREQGLQVIFAGSSPLVGSDKIGLQSPSEGVQCVDVWERMDDGNDKVGRNTRAHILSTTEVAAKTWVWHVEP